MRANSLQNEEWTSIKHNLLIHTAAFYQICSLCLISCLSFVLFLCFYAIVVLFSVGHSCSLSDWPCVCERECEKECERGYVFVSGL